MRDLQILRLENELATKRYEMTGSLLEFSDKEKLLSSFSGIINEVERLRLKTQ